VRLKEFECGGGGDSSSGHHYKLSVATLSAHTNILEQVLYFLAQ